VLDERTSLLGRMVSAAAVGVGTYALFVGGSKTVTKIVAQPVTAPSSSRVTALSSPSSLTTRQSGLSVNDIYRRDAASESSARHVTRVSARTTGERQWRDSRCPFAGTFADF
jgi:hypothetical protein